MRGYDLEMLVYFTHEITILEHQKGYVFTLSQLLQN